ncbi:hypothetical protein BDQ17DRAFT_1433361 [Cyathus striatus]|nr:hypothetical protein BDQ17DRAFT_1433361 [Cyathus striatus]
MKFNIIVYTYDPTDLFEVAIQILSSVPTENEVRKIYLNLFDILDLVPKYIDKSNGPTNWRFIDENILSSWEHLDALLTEPPFTRLEQVCFSFNNDSDYSASPPRFPSRDQMDSLLLSFLPKMSQRGLINIVMEDYIGQ